MSGKRFWISAIVVAAAALAAPPALAQPATPVQTPAEALAQDAAEYARLHGVDGAEATRRLGALEASVAETERLRARYRERLAGISIEHRPQLAISVLLTGDAPVRDRSIRAAGLRVPVRFRTGAVATHEQAAAALRAHADRVRAEIPGNEGIGYDQRNGEIVVLANTAAVDPETVADGEQQLFELTGVPVRIGAAGGDSRNASEVGGGSRVEGVDPASGRRSYCTTGFAVTDGTRTGLVTAAHCPDALELQAPDGQRRPLTFVGGWGAQYQDVQVHVSDGPPLPPLFYADRERRSVRALTGARSRTSTRAGDIACHRGESSGYGCAEVQLTDFAPPGALCGGPCDPVWITVTSSTCRRGDSGGPIFLGTTAFGIAKGGNWSRSGDCNFYYYMSADFLPEGWRLLTANGPDPAIRRRSDGDDVGG